MSYDVRGAHGKYALSHPPDAPRACADCKVMKSADEFHAKVRHPDGSVRLRQSYCKDCARERRRRSTGAQPRGKPLTKRQRALRRRQAERRKKKMLLADPEALETFRVEQRMDAAMARARTGLGRRYPMYKTWRGEPIPGRYRYALSDAERLDPEPFRLWLVENFSFMRRWDLALHLGLSERAVGKVLDQEEPFVTITVVDRAFVNIGRPDLLHLLYPLDEAEAA